MLGRKRIQSKLHIMNDFTFFFSFFMTFKDIQFSLACAYFQGYLTVPYLSTVIIQGHITALVYVTVICYVRIDYYID